MMKTIYLAGGCFWGTAHLFSLVPGVVSAEAGYANSSVTDPTYQMVCTGATGAAETVKVDYNPDEVGLTDLLMLYFKSIDPTSVNRQGNDRGTQYRTGIYYTDGADAEVVDTMLATLQRRYSVPLAVESGFLQNFYPAEEYHQDYLDKNPGGYCHIDPTLFAIARNARQKGSDLWRRHSDEELRRTLTPMQFAITRQNMTEPPFQNQYNAEFRKGIYVDVTTGEPLFLSSDKFESGCGWPAFSHPISDELITELPDYSHGRTRTEVRSSTGDAHLGHVFPDGPAEKGGLRYCINSAALRFIPLEDMAEKGYERFIPLVK